MLALSAAFGLTVPSAVVISSVPSFTFGMLFFTFAKVVGEVVPFGPLIDVITWSEGTSVPVPSALVLKSGLPCASFLSVGYTFVPSAFVYSTGFTALLVETWSSTFTVIVRTPVVASVLPETIAVPVPTNFTSFAFFTTSLYSPVPSVALSDETTQPIFCKSPTVAAAFLLTGAPTVPFKSTKSAVVGTAGVLPAGTLPVGVVLIVVLFNTEPTPTS